jgi:hypothetical protein
MFLNFLSLFLIYMVLIIFVSYTIYIFLLSRLTDSIFHQKKYVIKVLNYCHTPLSSRFKPAAARTSITVPSIMTYIQCGWPSQAKSQMCVSCTVIINYITNFVLYFPNTIIFFHLGIWLCTSLKILSQSVRCNDKDRTGYG